MRDKVDKMGESTFEFEDNEFSFVKPSFVNESMVSIYSFAQIKVEKTLKNGTKAQVSERIPLMIIANKEQSIQTGIIDNDTDIKYGEEKLKVLYRPVDLKNLPSKDFLQMVTQPDYNLKALSSIDFTKWVDGIYDYLERYHDFPSPQARKIVCMWIVNTFFFDCYPSVPYLQLTSVDKRCGKTHLLESVYNLSMNGFIGTDARGAVLFRTISTSSTTFCLDEIEGLNRKDSETKQDLVSILNSGYQDSGSVQRCEKETDGKIEVRTFDTFSPKAFASITALPSTLEDRCIMIILMRTSMGKYGERWFEKERLIKAKELREIGYILRLRFGIEIRKISQNLKEHFNIDEYKVISRDYEIFAPLLILMEKFKPEWKEEFKHYILSHLDMKAVETNPDNLLFIEALEKVIVDMKMGKPHQNEPEDLFYIRPKDVYNYIINNYSQQTKIETWTESRVGLLLKKLGFPKGIRTSEGIYRVVRLSTLRKAKASYNVVIQELPQLKSTLMTLDMIEEELKFVSVASGWCEFCSTQEADFKLSDKLDKLRYMCMKCAKERKSHIINYEVFKKELENRGDKRLDEKVI